MKILFLSAWFPFPPDNGSRIRIYNLIKTLSAKHKVYLVSLMQEDTNPENTAYLANICEVVSLHKSRWFKPGTVKSLLGFFSPKPRSYIDTFDPQVKLAVCNAIKEIKPDVIIASQIGAMIYVPKHISTKVIFEELEVGWIHRQVDNLSGIKRFRRQLTFSKQIRLTTEMFNRASLYTCVSNGELRLIEGCYNPNISGEVIPNGVDTYHYTPASYNPMPNSLIYNGALTYGANLDAVKYFASDICPMLLEKFPNVTLKVTGRTAGVNLTGIAGCPGIELTGYIDDIRTQLNAAAACIVPLREGGGSRLKILEAMAAGVPVISTKMGIEGINAMNGEHALVADTPADFTCAIEKILTDPILALKLSKNARRLVEEQYSWQTIGESFANIVEQVANKKCPAVAHK